MSRTLHGIPKNRIVRLLENARHVTRERDGYVHSQASHVRLRVRHRAQDRVDGRVQRHIVAMIFRVNPEDREAGRQRLKQFVIVQFARRPARHIEQEILSASR